MTEHPEDVAFLDAQAWASSWLRHFCDKCSGHASTIVVGHIEGASGPGYELRYCRACVALFLRRARFAAAQAQQPFVPSVPDLSPN